jgi:TPR repeat protein
VIKVAITKQFLRAPVFAFLVCIAFPDAGNCQVIDNLAEQGRSILKGLGSRPGMVSLIEEKALFCMTRAANRDYQYALVYAGLIYLSAKDIPNNYAMARDCRLKGAELNQADAWNGLGTMYSH